MQNCKLFIFSADELNIIQCRSENPASFVVETSAVSDEVINSAVFVRFEWYENDILHCAPVKIESVDGGRLKLALCGNIRQKDEARFHLIETNEPVEIIKVTDETLADFRMRSDAINNKAKSSLTTQIKQLLLDESQTNQAILKMLMQIDSKLDELLSVKRSNDIEGLKKSRIMCLSGGGACFMAESADVGDVFYIQSVSQNFSLSFALLAKVRHLIPTGKGIICESDFIYLDESTRDGIIRLVFERDREKLKRNKPNV